MVVATNECFFKKKSLNSSFTPLEISHKGERHKLSQAVQETQGQIEVFV